MLITPVMSTLAFFQALPFLPCLCFPIIGLIGLAATAFWIWMIVDCVSKEPSEGNDKVIWLLVIIFLQLLGAILYYAIRRPERIKRYGQ